MSCTPTKNTWLVVKSYILEIIVQKIIKKLKAQIIFMIPINQQVLSIYNLKRGRIHKISRELRKDCPKKFKIKKKGGISTLFNKPQRELLIFTGRTQSKSMIKYSNNP